MFSGVSEKFSYFVFCLLQFVSFCPVSYTHLSFSNCCLPYHLSGTIADSEDLVLMTPEKFHSQYNIDARTDSEVTGIDRDRKCVTVKNLLTGETYEESYDKLVLLSLIHL